MGTRTDGTYTRLVLPGDPGWNLSAPSRPVAAMAVAAAAATHSRTAATATVAVAPVMFDGIVGRNWDAPAPPTVQKQPPQQAAPVQPRLLERTHVSRGVPGVVFNAQGLRMGSPDLLIRGGAPDRQLIVAFEYKSWQDLYDKWERIVNERNREGSAACAAVAADRAAMGALQRTYVALAEPVMFRFSLVVSYWEEARKRIRNLGVRRVVGTANGGQIDEDVPTIGHVKLQFEDGLATGITQEEPAHVMKRLFSDKRYAMRELSVTQASYDAIRQWVGEQTGNLPDPFTGVYSAPKEFDLEGALRSWTPLYRPSTDQSFFCAEFIMRALQQGGLYTDVVAATVTPIMLYEILYDDSMAALKLSEDTSGYVFN